MHVCCMGSKVRRCLFRSSLLISSSMMSTLPFIFRELFTLANYCSMFQVPILLHRVIAATTICLFATTTVLIQYRSKMLHTRVVLYLQQQGTRVQQETIFASALPNYFYSTAFFNNVLVRHCTCKNNCVSWLNIP